MKIYFSQTSEVYAYRSDGWVDEFWLCFVADEKSIRWDEDRKRVGAEVIASLLSQIVKVLMLRNPYINEYAGYVQSDYLKEEG